MIKYHRFSESAPVTVLLSIVPKLKFCMTNEKVCTFGIKSTFALDLCFMKHPLMISNVQLVNPFHTAGRKTVYPPPSLSANLKKMLKGKFQVTLSTKTTVPDSQRCHSNSNLINNVEIVLAFLIFKVFNSVNFLQQKLTELILQRNQNQNLEVFKNININIAFLSRGSLKFTLTLFPFRSFFFRQ